MFETSQDILNMSLAIGFAILVVFLCIALFYLTMVLRDASKVTGTVKNMIEKTQRVLLEPLRMMDYVVDKVKPYVEGFIERKLNKKKK
ncbi:MAG: DUF948 domain-containing protein [Patescibacteria group bacterium]